MYMHLGQSDDETAQTTAEGGAVSILNPETGAVIAQSAGPTFEFSEPTDTLVPSAPMPVTMAQPAASASTPSPAPSSGQVTGAMPGIPGVNQPGGTVVNPIQLAPGVYVNPQSLPGVATTATTSGGVTTVAAAPNLATWLSESTIISGVTNLAVSLAAIAAFGGLVVIATMKKKR